MDSLNLICALGQSQWAHVIMHIVCTHHSHSWHHVPLAAGYDRGDVDRLCGMS